ncbi:MAG TPA: hypothetical protein PLD68_08700 [Clostridiales bacterium]|nr:hypothetical protein [Clostridiales bacterium]
MTQKCYMTQIWAGEGEQNDLERINLFTRKRVESGDVYAFNLTLCDNEVDRDFERFDSDALDELARLFVGKTGLFDHSMSGRDQTARLYRAQVEEDPARRTSAGEPYRRVAAAAYLPRTAKNADLIAEIDAGIKKEVSVACSVGKVSCSVCGADPRRAPCAHVPGREYGGKTCCRVLSEPVDAYEWSFVAVPAQRAAGVTKHYVDKGGKQMQFDELTALLGNAQENLTLTAEEAKRLADGIAAMKSLAEDGEAYRGELTGAVLKAGMAALPDIEGETLAAICAALGVKQLRALKSAFEPAAAAALPLKPQLAPQAPQDISGNEPFKI